MSIKKNDLESLIVISASERKMWSATKAGWAWMFMIHATKKEPPDRWNGFFQHRNQWAWRQQRSDPWLGLSGGRKSPPGCSTAAALGASVISGCWLGHKTFPFIRQQLLRPPACCGAFGCPPVSMAAAAEARGPLTKQTLRQAGFRGLRGSNDHGGDPEPDH